MRNGPSSHNPSSSTYGPFHMRHPSTPASVVSASAMEPAAGNLRSPTVATSPLLVDVVRVAGGVVPGPTQPLQLRLCIDRRLLIGPFLLDVPLFLRPQLLESRRLLLQRVAGHQCRIFRVLFHDTVTLNEQIAEQLGGRRRFLRILRLLRREPFPYRRPGRLVVIGE